MCAWNCEGWLQKLDLKEVVCFLRSFDIVSCLKRAWIQNNSMTRSVIMTFFLSKSTKLSLKGRTSGGVLIFVRKHLSSFIRHIEVPYENVIVLEVCNTLLGLCKNAFLISTYISPMTVNFGT